MNTEKILAVIAADIGLSVDSFRVDNEAVFYETPDGATRCACAVGTPYWVACAERAGQ